MKSEGRRSKSEIQKRRLCSFFVLQLFLALPGNGFAHRLDEYLQATLVTIGPREVRLHINLTPGVEVAQQVLERIDRNGDGTISGNEAAAYCEALKRDLLAQLDKHKLKLKLTASRFPAASELRTGWGIIQIELCATVGPLAVGAHKFTLKNNHLAALSVYLFNAAQLTSNLVRITAQNRNENQSLGEIEFAIDRPKNSLTKTASHLTH